ncbi:MAG: hypothetical protein LBH11_00230 [Propionibacteriaceae bacterium]|jgi:ABC-type bacteriocin/lantibiotic exporter with double-glycine peptidase domain|nr:hypothetical protein [Propionibacteriaceae bacterium]
MSQLIKAAVGIIAFVIIGGIIFDILGLLVLVAAIAIPVAVVYAIVKKPNPRELPQR